MITTLPALTAQAITILETESWHDVLAAIAKRHGVRTKLTSRVNKSADVFDRSHKRIGTIWEGMDNQVFLSIKHRTVSSYSTYESATLDGAITKIVDTCFEF